MDPRLAGCFGRHGNLMTRLALLAEGFTVRQLDEWRHRGVICAVRRGVYAPAAFWRSLDHATQRPLYLSRAASLGMTKPHLLSHDSAALEHGMQILRPDPFLIHVTRPGVLGSRTEFGVKHHKAPYRQDQVVVVNGWGVLDPARTAADIAREHGLLPGVVAFDSALRAGASADDLDRAVEPMRCWPGVTTVREAAYLADRGSQDVAETLGRLLVIELGYGRPETQFGLTDGRREVWCDLRLGRHIIEIDGFVKLRSVDDGGYAVDPSEALWEEKRRQDFVTGFKLGVSRLGWADVWGPGRQAALARLRREYLDTVDRFGTSTADLERFRIRRRPPFAA